MHQRHFWCYLPLLPLKNDRTSTNHEARNARGHICHRSWAFQRPSTMTFQCWTAPSAGASGVQLKGGSSRTAGFFFWTSRKQENSRLTRQWWSGRKKIPVKAIGFLTFSHGVPFLFPTSCGTAEFTPRLWHCLYGSRTSHQGDDLKGNIRVALVAFGGRIYFPAIVELYWGPISTELYNSYMYIIIYKYIYIYIYNWYIIYIFVFQAYHIYIYNYRIL